MDYEELAVFVKGTNDITVKWDLDDTQAWLTWADGHGFLLTIEDAGRVIGLMVARPVSHFDGMDVLTDVYNENGPVVWVDLCIAPGIEVFRGLGMLMARRFRKQSCLASKHLGKRLKVRDYHRAVNSLLKVRSNV